METDLMIIVSRFTTLRSRLFLVLKDFEDGILNQIDFLCWPSFFIEKNKGVKTEE
jgi:hypothetical protein